LQGEADAALDVASLLDDADSNIRRKAAEVSFALHAPAAAPAVRRAFERDEDDEVRRWSALALVRIGEPVPTLAESLLRDPRRDFRRAAALALAERADARGCDELAAWWSDVAPTAAHDGPDREPNRISVDLAHAEEMLGATAEAHCRAAVPSLLRALADVRARPYIADTLGALGDDRARSPLIALLAEEPYVTTRPHEARALLALGARDWVGDPNSVTEVTLMASAHRSRVVALLSDATASVEVFAEGAPASGIETEGEVRTFDLPPGIVLKRDRPVRLKLHASRGGVTAVWLVAPAASTSSPDAGDLIDPP
jgi:HEAT repeat protein